MPESSAPPVANFTAQNAPPVDGKQPADGKQPVPAGKKQLVLTPKQTEEVIARLSRFEPRPEYEETPGPYPVKYNPNARRIPFVFRSSGRFESPTGGSAKPTDEEAEAHLKCESGGITIEQCSITLPRSRDIIFSSQPRVLKVVSATANASVYDVEAGLRATEPRVFSVVFPHHGDVNCGFSAQGHSSNSKEASPARTANPVAVDSLSQFLSFGAALVAGSRGRISPAPRKTDESFILRSCSPGPIYAPKLDAIRPTPSICKFSESSRMQTPKGSVDAGDDATRSHDWVREVDLTQQHALLSTWETAPTVRMRPPREEFVHPNKQRCPPPPADDDAEGSSPVKRRVVAAASRLSERRQKIANILTGTSSLLGPAPVEEAAAETLAEPSGARPAGAPAAPCNISSGRGLTDVAASNSGTAAKSTATRSRPASAVLRRTPVGFSSAADSPFALASALADLKLTAITLGGPDDTATVGTDRTTCTVAGSSSVGYSRPSSAAAKWHDATPSTPGASRPCSSSGVHPKKAHPGNDPVAAPPTAFHSPQRHAAAAASVYDLRGSHSGSYSKAAAAAMQQRHMASKKRVAFPARLSHAQRVAAATAELQHWTTSSTPL